MSKIDQAINRELSWLQFNARVLNEACDPRTPLLERVRFIQIFTTNLDEFFMKRVGGLKRQEACGIDRCDNWEGTLKELLSEIRTSLLPMLKTRSECWNDQLSPSLEREGILLLSWADLSLSEQNKIESYFDQNLFGALTPLTVDPGHPFPFISNLSTSIGITLRSPEPKSPKSHKTRMKQIFARVKIPNNYPSWVRLPQASEDDKTIKLISLREVIRHFLPRLFPNREIVNSFFFRLTRNADMDPEDEEMEDLLETVAEQLKARRFANVVRLESSGSSVDESVLKMLQGELNLTPNDTYQGAEEIDFSTLHPIWDLHLSKYKYRNFSPVAPEALKSERGSIFSIIGAQDILLHHPYESFSLSVERFISTAVHDPNVLAIKMVLYRTGIESPFITLLTKAAEGGKQVVCLVELKARFDEESNIQVARRLERSGVHVVYGIMGLKTHCKVALVVRKEGASVRSYAHIGTGNYNANTATAYTDFGLLTADPVLTRDTIKLFHYLTGGAADIDFEKLVVGPVHMKQKFIQLIRNEKWIAEGGGPAHIIAKMNSLEDPEIIQELTSASKAGVKIDLIVRGFCCLRPKVPGLSENISVTSVIGRFLEHSRVFYFRNGSTEKVNGTFLIGSADWMTRNLNWRVEVLAPLEAPELRAKMIELLGILLSDQRQVWELNAQGTYTQRSPKQESQEDGVQNRFLKMYHTLEVELGF